MSVGRADRDVLYAACRDAGNEATTKHLYNATVARPHVTQPVEWFDVLERRVENEAAVTASESVATLTLTCRYGHITMDLLDSYIYIKTDRQLDS